MKPIYLDHQATTPLDPEVWEAMVPFFTEHFGNAASRHHVYGWQAETAVKNARGALADLLGCEPEEIIWTSGATESINMALKGFCASVGHDAARIITSQIEHRATLDACEHLAKCGVSIDRIDNDATGLVNLQNPAFAEADPATLVSVIHANNEIGTIQDIDALSGLVASRGALLHLDAAQSFGKVSLDVKQQGVALASLSAHKLYGPKGIGALYVARKPKRLKLAPLIHGGGQERGLRSGTLNVPAIVGFGAAATIAKRRMKDDALRIRALQNRLLDALMAGIEGLTLNGHPERRLDGNLNVTIEGVESESLIRGLSGVALSNGSACTSLSIKPSHVLQACGLSETQAFSSIRLGLGRFTTEEEVDRAAAEIVEQAARLAALQCL